MLIIVVTFVANLETSTPMKTLTHNETISLRIEFDYISESVRGTVGIVDVDSIFSLPWSTINTFAMTSY